MFTGKFSVFFFLSSGESPGVRQNPFKFTCFKLKSGEKVERLEGDRF